MQIMLNVPNEKALFVMEVLNNFSFSTTAVEITDNNNIELQKLLSEAGISLPKEFTKKPNAIDKLCGMFENTSISSFKFAENKKHEIELEEQKISRKN
jgi:hypothetical protein